MTAADLSHDDVRAWQGAIDAHDPAAAERCAEKISDFVRASTPPELLRKHIERSATHIALFPSSRAGLFWAAKALDSAGRTAESWSFLEKVEELDRIAVPLDRSRVLDRLEAAAVILKRLGRTTEAIERAEAALDLVCPDSPRETYLLRTISLAHFEQRDVALAIEGFEQLVRRSRALHPEYPCALASALHQLGVAHENIGNLDEARRALEESAELKRTLEQPSDASLAPTLQALSAVLDEFGEKVEAGRLLEDATQLYIDAGNLDGHANCLFSKACRAYDDDDRATARRLVEEAIKVRMKITGDDRQLCIASNLVFLGRIHLESGDLAPALAIVERAKAIVRDVAGTDIQRRFVQVLVFESEVWASQRRRIRAMDCLFRAREIAIQVTGSEESLLVARLDVDLGLCSMARKRESDAAVYFARADHVLRRIAPNHTDRKSIRLHGPRQPPLPFERKGW